MATKCDGNGANEATLTCTNKTDWTNAYSKVCRHVYYCQIIIIPDQRLDLVILWRTILIRQLGPITTRRLSSDMYYLWSFGRCFRNKKTWSNNDDERRQSVEKDSNLLNVSSFNNIKRTAGCPGPVAKGNEKRFKEMEITRDYRQL